MMQDGTFSNFYSLLTVKVTCKANTVKVQNPFLLIHSLWKEQNLSIGAKIDL